MTQLWEPCPNCGNEPIYLELGGYCKNCGNPDIIDKNQTNEIYGDEYE